MDREIIHSRLMKLVEENKKNELRGALLMLNVVDIAEFMEGLESDKLLWVKRHLGKLVYKRLILSHHKNLLRGDYLIDDSTKNGAAEFQGTHIQFGKGDYIDWPSVIEFFKNQIH